MADVRTYEVTAYHIHLRTLVNKYNNHITTLQQQYRHTFKL